MKQTLFVITIGVLFSNLCSQPNAVNHSSYIDVFNHLISMTHSQNQKVATVNNLVLHRDVAQFHLTNGKIYLLPPVNNRFVSALYIGEGSFSFKPSDEIERDQLFRYFEKKEIDEKIEFVFFIFHDHTLEELENKLDFVNAASDEDLSSFIEEGLECICHEESKYFDVSIMKSLLDEKSNGLFYAHIDLQDMDPLFFKVDPYEEEEIILSRRSEASIFYDYSEIICQFQKYEDYALSRYGIEEDKDLLRIKQYKIKSVIEDDMDFSAETKLTFTIEEPDQKWIYFYLYFDLIVDSVFWEDGKPASYFRGEENPFLWIKIDSTLKGSNDYSLKMYYHGELIERQMDWFRIRSSSNWYPKYGGRNLLANFDLTFYTPENMTFVSVGDKISSSKAEDYLVTRWLTSTPIRNASFNIGFFEEFEIEDEQVPPIIIYMAKYGHQEIG